MKLAVSEVFYSIQGEGITTGVPSVFVRLGGCNLMCGGIDDTDPKRGFIGQAFYIVSRPVVEPVKAIFKAAGWASDQVTRAYRVGAMLPFSLTDLVS